MTTDIKSPFKFLDAYSQEDKAIFFGRSLETEELYDRVFETDLVLLYGASGTGKTSLINCGLANQFESTDWLPILIRRNNGLLSDLHTIVSEKTVKPIAAEATIEKKLRSLYLDFFKPIYLIFDQFEELFIQGSKKEQQQFFEVLNSILIAGIQCKVILSMREEWIASLSNFEQIIPNLFDNRQRVEQMTRSNLVQVVEGTAEAFDIELAGGERTVNQIIDNVQDPKQGIELANLQIYLDKLYRNDYKRRNDQNRPIRFDQELVASARQLEDVLSDFLREQLDVLAKELADKFELSQKAIPLDVLFALVTEDGTKKSIALTALKKQLQRRKNIAPEIVDYCIKRFNDLRIIRILNGEIG